MGIVNAPRLVIGVVALLVGIVWLGQGLGIIGGSAMTGSGFWGVVGALLIVLAAWLIWTGWRRYRPG
jgi:hypothetical protein